MEGRIGREEPRSSETQHHSSLQCHDKSQTRRLGEVSNVAVLKTTLHFILEQGGYTTHQKSFSPRRKLTGKCFLVFLELPRLELT